MTSVEDCWLEDLWVEEDTRRSGLGRALVAAACDRAREHGCRRIELDTSEENAPALALYTSVGFGTKGTEGRSLFLQKKL